MNSFLISTSFGLPVVQTKAASSQSAAAEETSQKVKVSSLPLYPEPEKYLNHTSVVKSLFLNV